MNFFNLLYISLILPPQGCPGDLAPLGNISFNFLANSSIWLLSSVVKELCDCTSISFKASVPFFFIF